MELALSQSHLLGENATYFLLQEFSRCRLIAVPPGIHYYRAARGGADLKPVQVFLYMTSKSKNNEPKTP